MALKMRLARGGTKNRPFYRIVIADADAPRDGRFVERIGFYNPLAKEATSEKFSLSEDRARYWLSVGVQPTERVALFLARAGVVPASKQPNRPHKSQPKKKAQERAKAAAAAVTPEGAPA